MTTSETPGVWAMFCTQAGWLCETDNQCQSDLIKLIKCLRLQYFFFLVGCRKMLLIARWYCWLYSHYVPLYTILIPWKPHWIPNGGYVSLAMSVFGKKHRNTHSISQIHESIFCQWFTFINQWTNRPMDHSLSECQVIGTRRPPWTSSAAMQPVGTTTACEASQ